jgi:flavoprotein
MGGIVEEINGKIFLSKKGKKLAQIYVFLLDWLNIKSRKEYREYFFSRCESLPVFKRKKL